jgi:hypothetical protein
MICPTCSGALHVSGLPCPVCYASGVTEADPAPPVLAAARLTLRATRRAQEAIGARDARACLRDAAHLRSAAVITLGQAQIRASTRDAEALHGVQEASVSGLALDAYVGLIVPWMTARGRVVLARWLLGQRTADLPVAARALGVLRG